VVVGVETRAAVPTGAEAQNLPVRAGVEIPRAAGVATDRSKNRLQTESGL
jgi:hypothetical protein